MESALIAYGDARLPSSCYTCPCAGLVFPSVHGKALNDTTISKLIRDLGIAAVPHGFRLSLRDWAAERTNHPREVIEAALAHTRCGIRPRPPTRGRTCSSAAAT